MNDQTKIDCFTREGEYIATLPNFQQAKMYINRCTTYEGVEYKPHSRSVTVPELKLELSPCPFCNGEAGIWQSSELDFLHKVSCWNCAACSDWENYHDLPKLIEKWNARPSGGELAACEKDLFHALRLMFEGKDEDRLMYLEKMAKRYESIKLLAEKYPRAHSPISRAIFPCSNCKELERPCACVRNKCQHCGEPVGNITFVCCDNCWDKKYGGHALESAKGKE